ncbi:MAG TPA: hypothetical protein VKS82_19070 [Streptosporangiaceae bacterium]|nr:hypothetical protein [Streptosporangiaceae bacterium]
MALIAIAADKGAPGVTTAATALGAVWPRPVLLAECDPAGSDLVYRFPSVDGGHLDPNRGLLSLAVAARRGIQPHQVWEHSQKLYGGLDILAGVSGAEQGAGLELLWGAVGRTLASVPEADVIADCGRLGLDSPVYDLLAHASSVVLLSRATVGEVIRLRERISALAAGLQRRGRPGARIDVVVVADHKKIGSAIEEVGHALRQAGAPGRIIGGLAYEPRSAEQLSGQWGSKLDKSMYLRTVRAVASYLVTSLPEIAGPPQPQAGPPQPQGVQPPPQAGPPQPQGMQPPPPPGGQVPPPPGARPPQPSYQPPPREPLHPQNPAREPRPHPSYAWQPEPVAASPQPYSAPVPPGPAAIRPGPSEPATGPQPAAGGFPPGRGRHAGTAAGHPAPQAHPRSDAGNQPQPARDRPQPEPTSGTRQGGLGGGG